MTTINASEEAHRKIMQQRHTLEEETGKVVSTAQALDTLLRINEEGVKNDRRNMPVGIE